MPKAGLKRIAIGAAVLLGVLAPGVHAGTTIIRVETEGAGDIIQYAGNRRNTNGAMVWNGTEWVVNATWVHKYFVDVRTGQRLKNYTTHDVSLPCTDPGEDRPDGYGNFRNVQTVTDSAGRTYTVTARDLWYTKAAASGPCGAYHYGTLEYTIVDDTTGKQVILRSRGVGAGRNAAYFDVYIDDEAGTGSQAFCNDPAWFTYGVPASQATGEACGATAERTGELPGAVSTQGTPYGDYYLDIGGGSDMGGKSHQLHTAPLFTRMGELSASYVTGYELKFMDGRGNLQRITVSPCLLRETPMACATAAPVPPLGGTVFAVLAAALAVAGAVRLRRGRAA